MSAENTPLSNTLEDYLVAIFHLEMERGAARSRDIAEAQGVSRSTVTSALKALAARGLIEYQPYSLVRLTPQGEPLAREIAHRNMILRRLFGDVLQLDRPLAEATACRVEHAVDAQVIKRLGQFLLYLERTGLQLDRWREDYAACMRRKPHPGPDTQMDGPAAREQDAPPLPSPARAAAPRRRKGGRTG